MHLVLLLKSGTLEKCATYPLFLAKVLFFDEAFYTRERVFYTNNTHIWVKENLHAIQLLALAAKTQFLVSV